MDERTATSAPGLISTRAEFHTAVRAAFAEAAQRGCREIWLCDVDFADWPLGERAVVEQLTQWAQSHRKLTLLAQTFDELPRRHARWVEWRRTWSHVVQCRNNPELEAGEMPTVMLTDGLSSIRMVDPIHYRGRVSHEPAELLHCREIVEAVLQRSIEAFPVSTTGL